MDLLVNTSAAHPAFNTDLPRHYTHAIQVMATIIGVPVIFFGVLGNLLTVVTVIKTKWLRTGPNLFIVSLSVSDMLYSGIIIPCTLVVYWKNAWVFGATYCKIFPFLLTMFYGGTLVSLGGIALSRFLKILHPGIYQRVFGRKRNAGVLLAIFLLLPLVCLLPAMCGIWGELGYEPKTLTCTIVNDGSRYVTFLLLIAFLLPIILITYCYLKIMVKIVKNHTKIANMRAQNAPNSALSSQFRQHREQREDLRFTKMMVIIYVVFIVSYAPSMLNNLLDPQIDNMNKRTVYIMFTWMSCCLNPLVYVILNKHFRRAFADISLCKKHSGDWRDVNSVQSVEVFHIAINRPSIHLKQGLQNVATS